MNLSPFPHPMTIKLSFRCLLLLLTLTLPLAGQTATETAYVAQGIAIELKVGISKKDKVIQPLEPGTPLKVLKRNTKLGYVKVQLESGESGWIPLRAITSKPPPVEPPAESTPSAPPSLSAQQAQAERDHLQTELQAVRQASANVLRIQAERDQLQESVISLRKELDTALREKNVLNDDQKQAWFLLGGGVLLIGIVLGVVLPRLRPRRRHDWGSF